jgi:hypothetical protein
MARQAKLILQKQEQKSKCEPLKQPRQEQPPRKNDLSHIVINKAELRSVRLMQQLQLLLREQELKRIVKKEQQRCQKEKA